MAHAVAVSVVLAPRYELGARTRQARPTSYLTYDAAGKTSGKSITRFVGSSMKWFRFYSEVMNDPKVQDLRPELFKFWVNALCLANESTPRGTLPTAAEIGFHLRMQRRVIDRFLGELAAAYLIHPIDPDGAVAPEWQAIEASENGVRRLGEASATSRRRLGDVSAKLRWSVATRFRIHHWSARQPISDNIHERVKRHREKTSGKQAPPDVTLHVTGQERYCNVTVTAPDIDIELEGDKSPPCIAPPTDGMRVRAPDDRADVEAACKLLTSDLTTHAVGLELARVHGSPSLVGIAGWKWLRAARKLQECRGSKRGSWKYFAAIAAGLTDADRDEPLRCASANGHVPRPSPRLPDVPKPPPGWGLKKPRPDSNSTEGKPDE